jgi:hypothetical protein
MEREKREKGKTEKTRRRLRVGEIENKKNRKRLP